MNLSSLAVRRAVAFSMVFLLVLGAGFYGLSRLKVDMYPDLSFPTVMVMTGYTGASPEDIETLVSRPMEEGLAAVEGVEKLRSESKRGISVITVKFDWGRDMDQAETDVRRALELVEGRLPDGADAPIVFAMDPSMQPVVILLLSGPDSLAELRTLAEDDIAPRLERLPGIASASVEGGEEREIQVVLDPDRLTAFGVDVNVVVGALFQENLQEPGGSIEQGTLDLTLQTEGRYQSVEEIGQILIGTRPGAAGPEPLRLADVARIEDGFKERLRIIEVDGKPTAWIMVRKQSGANTVEAVAAVEEMLPQIKKSLGGRVEFQQLFNQADFISASMGNLSSTALLAVLITFLVLLVFLRSVRSSLTVAAAIPFSLLATFFVMDQADMTLNMISLAGLALAVGMVVDNAIVVLENVVRLREEGLGLREAAIQGAAEVGTAISASTLTTVAVFVPVLFVPGIAGVLFRDMALTIVFALLASLLVALSFVPLVASRLLSKKPVAPRAEGQQAGPFARFQAAYGALLAAALRRRWAVGVGLAALLGLTVLAAATMPTDFMAANDQSQLFVNLETAVANNLDETHRIAREAEALIAEAIPVSERRLIASDVGAGGGFAALFAKGTHAGTVRVPLVAPSQRERSQADYEQLLRDRLREVPGLEVTTGSHMSLTGSSGDLTVSLVGHDLAEAQRVGKRLEARLEAMPEVAEVSFSMQERKPQISIRFDREKMSALGLSSASVGKAISTFFKGRVAGRYSEGGDEHDILVRFDEARRGDLGELRRMPAVAAGGKVLRLDTVARIEEVPGPVAIEREDQQRVSELTVTLRKAWRDADGRERRKDLNGAIARVEAELSRAQMPEGFTWRVGGTAEDFRESFLGLALALLVAVLLVYMVMAGQFESLRMPFIVLFTLPLAATGVVLIFVLTGSTIEVSALIGVILLAGIAVNNGIVLIDAANQLRDAGLGLFEAALQAGRQRLRPVLLTSLTTILAMVPLALEIGEGSESWSGMARAVIGGLSVSTLLTLIVVPVMYTLFAGKRPAAKEVSA